MHLVYILQFITALALGNAFVLQEQREFGLDDGFGDSFIDQSLGKSNRQAFCSSPCKSSGDCCDGYTCKRFHPATRYGYCTKKCLPVGPQGDCRRCQECVSGYICTILLNQHYVCLKRNK